MYQSKSVVAFIKYGAVLGACSFLLTGCATMFTSDNISFNVKSKPEGANVQVNRLHGSTKEKAITTTCVTPCHLILRQTHSYIFKVQKDGYKNVTKIVKSEDSVEGDAGSLTTNLLAFGVLAPVGMGVDAISGADDRLFPGSLDITLEKSTTTK